MPFDHDLIQRYLAGDEAAALRMHHECEAARRQRRSLESMRHVRTSFMFTDIVDSAGLYDTYGDEYGHAVVGQHNEMVSACVRIGGGDLVKFTGDGMLALFPSGQDAVRTGVRIQQRIAQHRAAYPLLAFRVRIGINVGPAITAHNDRHGASVNLAARLCQAAPADGIYTTGIVASRCRELGLGFVEMGTMFFKGFASPVPVERVRVPD